MSQLSESLIDFVTYVRAHLKGDEKGEAAVELDREHHQAGGVLDVIKGLFLWVESPEERVKSDRSL